MKIGTKTKTIVSSIALTKEEVDTLVSAQRILDNIWDKLEKADAVDTGTPTHIYNSVNEVGFALDEIVNSVDIEDY